MKCELCRKTDLGDYVLVGESKKSKYNDQVVVLPCCKAEVCKDCYVIIMESKYCEFCGKELVKR